MSGNIGSLKNRALICVHLRSSVFICGKNLTPDDNRQFDDLTHGHDITLPNQNIKGKIIWHTVTLVYQK